MSRNELPKTKTTTIVASKLLMNRISSHVQKSDGDKQQDFIIRAFVNQLEREGDFEIRSLLEAEQEETEV